VGVATDEMAAANKGVRPAIPFEDRCAIVSAIKGVADVIPHRKIDDLADWEALHYNRFFKGSDWLGHPRFVELSASFAARGVEVVFLPYTSHVSTTLLRDRLGAQVALSLKSQAGATTASNGSGASVAESHP
jgi:glycerol-3-phosphate cytidylyltransferase